MQLTDPQTNKTISSWLIPNGRYEGIWFKHRIMFSYRERFLEFQLENFSRTQKDCTVVIDGGSVRVI